MSLNQINTTYSAISKVENLISVIRDIHYSEIGYLAPNKNLRINHSAEVFVLLFIFEEERYNQIHLRPNAISVH